MICCEKFPKRFPVFKYLVKPKSNVKLQNHVSFKSYVKTNISNHLYITLERRKEMVKSPIYPYSHTFYVEKATKKYIDLSLAEAKSQGPHGSWSWAVTIGFAP